MFNRFLRSRRATDLTSRSRRTSNDDWTSGNPETTAIEQPTASPNTVPPASVMQGPTVIQPVNSEPAPVMDPSSPTPLSQTPTSTIQTPTTSCTPTASSTPTVSTLSNVSSSTRQTISGSLKQRRAANIRYVGIQALDKALLAETYYHGVTTREEVEQRLSRDGDFLVCIPDDTTQNQATVAIGVRYGGRVRFFVIGKTKRARFHITEKSFDSIPLLIQHYSSTREPLTHDLPIVIKNAIPLPSYIITHDRIRLGTLIGKGAFGYVFKATLVCGQKTETVAVKSLKGKSTNDSRQRALFLQEARTMREYHHVNIVNFIGIASQQEPLMLILEFCVGGSLLNYLRNNGPELSIATRFRFATEAAAGLRYLERCRCIHRDISQWNNDCRQQCLTTTIIISMFYIAARNCLLSDQLVCKISDFGLSIKDAGLSQDDPNSRMPVKWCSPEVLRYRQFSSKSDVWAYGVLLFEIFTDGSEPYGKMTTTEVRALLTGVTLYRMELPNEIPLNVKKLMCECFEEDPQHRPTMKQIHRQLCALKF